MSGEDKWHLGLEKEAYVRNGYKASEPTVTLSIALKIILMEILSRNNMQFILNLCVQWG